VLSGHGVQLINPLSLAYCPDTQSVQLPGVVWYLPRSQDVQEVSPALLVSPLVPVPHFVHRILFWLLDTKPFGHAEHESVDASTYWPAEQEEQATLPVEEVRPDAHASHVVFRFVSTAKVLAPHFLHESSPSSFWYMPGMQSKHDALPLVGFLNP